MLTVLSRERTGERATSERISHCGLSPRPYKAGRPFTAFLSVVNSQSKFHRIFHCGIYFGNSPAAFVILSEAYIESMNLICSCAISGLLNTQGGEPCVLRKILHITESTDLSIDRIKQIERCRISHFSVNDVNGVIHVIITRSIIHYQHGFATPERIIRNTQIIL